MGRQLAVTIPGGGEQPELEGILDTAEGAGRSPAAVVCHPHPLGGGSMHNNVVVAMAREMEAQGMVVLRFNFRGVGRSGGRHDNGRGERRDVAAAIQWLAQLPTVDPERLCLAGYSFGAWVGLSLAQSDLRVKAAVAVGLVAWHYDAEFFRTQARPEFGFESWQYDPSFLCTVSRPKCFIGAEHDTLAPPSALKLLVARLPEPKVLHVLPGADHSFRGHEKTVGELTARFLVGQQG